MDGNPEFPVNRAFNDESIYYRRRKEDELKFLVARPGDWLFSPFQCDLCWFFNLHGRRPIDGIYTDQFEVKLIRRANLDMFWSRAPSTIAKSRGLIREIISRAQERGRRIPLEPMEAWKVEDGMGMGIAIQMLEKSLKRGKNASYTQFDSVRQLRAAASNLYSATSTHCESPLSLKAASGAVLHMYNGPMQSVLMERFALGMQARMPQKQKRNRGFSGRLCKSMLDLMDEEWENPHIPPDRRRDITMVAGYIAVAYGYALRGNEGFWVDAQRLCDNLHVGRNPPVGEPPHIVVSLLGRFKNEQGERMHVLTLANRTRSGIEIRKYLERVATVLTAEHKRDCPAFCDSEGFMLSESFVESVFHPFLERIQRQDSENQFLLKGVDIRENFRCFRSFRRGAETEALVQKVSETIIRFVMRWRNYERSQGKAPRSFSMMDHYAEGVRTRPLEITFVSSV